MVTALLALTQAHCLAVPGFRLFCVCVCVCVAVSVRLGLDVSIWCSGNTFELVWPRAKRCCWVLTALEECVCVCVGERGRSGLGGEGGWGGGV